MKITKNKKGFTLVELLAVIVILALIMSIAVVSMGNIMQSARRDTFRETALQMIAGVRQRLYLAGKLDAGTYYFSSDILEKGGTTSPLGGDIQYQTSAPTGATTVASGIWKVTSSVTCSATAKTFVKITYNSTTDKYTYSICVTAGSGNPFIKDATEAALLQKDNDTTVFSGL